MSTSCTGTRDIEEARGNNRRLSVPLWMQIGFALAVTILEIGFFTGLSLRNLEIRFLKSEANYQSSIYSSLLSGYAEEALKAGNVEALRKLLVKTVGANPSIYSVSFFDSSGKPLAAWAPLKPFPEEVIRRDVRIPGHGVQAGRMRIIWDLDDIVVKARNNVRKMEFFVILLLSVLFATLCLWFNRLIVQPVSAMAARLANPHESTDCPVDYCRTKELICLNDAITSHLHNEQEANKIQAQFLANLSHEIRTPITSIIGFAESLSDEDLSGSDRENAVGTILESAERLLGFLNNVIGLSELDSGDFKVEKQECSPFAIVEESIASLRGEAVEKGLELSVRYEMPLPEILHTDPFRLKQILFNIVHNALKFTESGEVSLKVSYMQEKNRVFFEIRDTGIGLSEENRKKMFEAFSQGDMSDTRRFGGLGLGLVVSKRFASLLGGDLTFESREGEGSVFMISIPAGPSDKIKLCEIVPEKPVDALCSETSVESGNLSGRILVVDDGEANRQLLQHMLKKVNLEAWTAENGREAVDLVMAEKFDLVLMDMQMPVMDGFAAVREIRKNGITVPIVAVTANVLPRAKAECLEAGCNDYLAKPFKKEKILSLIGTYIAREKNKSEPGGEDANPLPESLIKDIKADSDYGLIVLSFVDSLKERQNDLEAACKTGDWEKIAKIAHKLISSELFGFPAITASARELEEASKEKREKDIAAHSVQMKSAISSALESRERIAREIEK